MVDAEVICRCTGVVISTFKLKKFSLIPLLASTLFACGETEGTVPEPIAVTLNFSAQIGEKKADCNTDYVIGTNDTSAKLADARMFVSEIEVQNEAGFWKTVTLATNDWQHENIGLIDFEDGTGSCKDSGTSETNTTLSGLVTTGIYRKIRFSLGVPFEFNHIDNATAPAPLNTPGMFWVWKGGYKFFRVDWLVSGGDVPRYNAHLGSTGCESAAPTTAPEERCKKSNMPKVELDISGVEDINITFDLETLVANTDLKTNVMDTPPGCQSNPMEGEDCKNIFSTLGLSFDSGSCENNCDDQTAFSLAE